jgi:mono/diheme cytochrome c family protein
MIITNSSKALVLSLLLLVAGGLAACGSAPPGNAENGKKWFTMNNCNSCHGEQGVGGRGPAIVPLTMTFGSFVKKLRTTNAAIMPPYPESKISEQDAADIYAYLIGSK